MLDLLRELSKLNVEYGVPQVVYDLVSGLAFTVLVFAYIYFKHVPSVNKTLRLTFNTGLLLIMGGMLINRLLHFPPAVAMSSFVALVGYLFLGFGMLLSGAAAKKRKLHWEEQLNGYQTISTTKDRQPLS